METHVTTAGEAERLIRCFDPHASLVEADPDHIVISPRFGRLRRRHPLLAASPRTLGVDAAWASARQNLLTCRDLSVQLALSTYEYRVRIEFCIPVDSLRDPGFDLHRHGHALLDRRGEERAGITLRRESFWIRSLPPDTAGLARFEIGNCFLLPITDEAMLAEARHMW
ncbi:MAG TPA: hypothetical protein VMD25_11005 [Acidobacteriaceae bacterium]|nr:hypothetical protein [Acidobacteriaceae bacterium]